MFRFLWFIARAVVALFYRVQAEGVENVPTSGAAVVCANHAYYKDLLLIGSRVPRKIRWAAKSELFRNPLFAMLIKFLGAFPVHRGTRDRDAVKTMHAVLQRGELLGIFPDGKRVLAPQDRPPVRRGFVSLAADADVPLLPISLCYGTGPFGRGKIFSHAKLTFGKPIRIDPQYKNERAALNAIASSVMSDIYDMAFCESTVCPPSQRN